MNRRKFLKGVFSAVAVVAISPESVIPKGTSFATIPFEQYEWKQLAGSIVISGRDAFLLEQKTPMIFKLLEKKLERLESDLYRIIDA